MGAPSPELVDLWVAKAFNAAAGAGARSAKEASHA
jgi:hypothetical protein